MSYALVLGKIGDLMKHKLPYEIVTAWRGLVGIAVKPRVIEMSTAMSMSNSAYAIPGILDDLPLIFTAVESTYYWIKSFVRPHQTPSDAKVWPALGIDKAVRAYWDLKEKVNTYLDKPAYLFHNKEKTSNIKVVAKQAAVSEVVELP
jgi:hypothetical protein